MAALGGRGKPGAREPGLPGSSETTRQRLPRGREAYSLRGAPRAERPPPGRPRETGGTRRPRSAEATRTHRQAGGSAQRLPNAGGRERPQLFGKWRRRAAALGGGGGGAERGGGGARRRGAAWAAETSRSRWVLRSSALTQLPFESNQGKPVESSYTLRDQLCYL